MTTEELKHIAAILAEIQKKGSGFKTPDAYFDEIENIVTSKLFVATLPKDSGHETPDDYFKEVESSVLSKLKNEQNSSQDQTIPAGYFDNLEDKVFARLAQEKKPKVFSLKKYWIPAAVAASLLLFVTIYNSFAKKQTLQLTEVEAWIEEGNLELNSYEIAKLYTDEIENININTTLDAYDLEDYLNDEISEESFYN